MVRKLVIGLLLVMAICPLLGQEWVLEKEKAGIQVFTRKVAGYAIKEYKAIIELETTISDLNKLMRDHENMKNWFIKCPISDRLKKVSDQEYYVYFLNDAPWPVSDRDNITQIKFELLANGTQLIHLKGVPDYLPEKSGIIRIPRMNAKWMFESLSTGKVRVTQQVLADLGGKIPAWLINFAIVEAPYETLHNLREQLKK